MSLTHKTFFFRDVVVNLGKKNLKLGLKGHPLIIDGEFEAAIKVEESAWVLEDKRTLVLSIGKSRFWFKISPLNGRCTEFSQTGVSRLNICL